MERTARAYGTRAEVVPGMGDNMTLEDGWAEVAGRIEAWVRQNVATGRDGW